MYGMLLESVQHFVQVGFKKPEAVIALVKNKTKKEHIFEFHYENWS